MKTGAKRVLATLTLVMMLMGALLAALPISAAGANGMTFSQDVTYTVEKAITQNPNTFEAVIMIPTTVTGRGGVILGNYNKYPCISFEVTWNGQPRLYTNKTAAMDSANNVDLTFDDVHVNTGEKLHLAIVRDTANQKVYCYVDGVLKQTLDCTYTEPFGPFGANELRLGGDFRDSNTNTNYFKGTIYSATMYSDVRSATAM